MLRREIPSRSTTKLSKRCQLSGCKGGTISRINGESIHKISFARLPKIMAYLLDPPPAGRNAESELARATFPASNDGLYSQSVSNHKRRQKANLLDPAP